MTERGERGGVKLRRRRRRRKGELRTVKDMERARGGARGPSGLQRPLTPTLRGRRKLGREGRLGIELKGFAGERILCGLTVSALIGGVNDD